jgi:hypothetical protein
MDSIVEETRLSSRGTIEDSFSNRPMSIRLSFWQKKDPREEPYYRGGQPGFLFVDHHSEYKSRRSKPSKKGGFSFQRLESREIFRSRALYFLVVSLRGMDCKYYVIEDSFHLFLSDCLLSLHVVLFFLFGCNISDLWTPEVVEDLLSYCPFFMVHHSDIFYFSSRWEVASLIYGFLRW